MKRSALAFLPALLLMALLAAALMALLPIPSRAAVKVTIGSKAFPESWILGDALKILASRAPNVEIEHKNNLGGTEIVYGALKAGSIDLYPEYTGTVAQVMMKSPGRPTMAEMRAYLAGEGVGMSDSLGFNDGYALATTAAIQKKYGLYKISDLARHPDLRLAFSHEFVGRKDGWVGLAQHYGLTMSNVRGIQHELAYDAIAGGQIDVTEIYTTDAEIDKLGLKILRDDKAFFPRYDAVLLYRIDLPKRAPAAFSEMTRLVSKVDEARMIRANARVVLKKENSMRAAEALLRESLGSASPSAPTETSGVAAEIARDTARHLELVAISLLAAILLGIPLGVLATRSRALAMVTLTGAGLLQTIPSLALLAFLIPLFGIGLVPALVALFLYSLLPIVRNTYTGLETVPPHLAEAAEALGMTPRDQLLRIRLPMASPAILAGVKTSAVINVGTATLAALIGAGGLGNPILQGIALRDTRTILEGAIPAALLAFLVQGAFDLLDRVAIPPGLRLSERRS